MFYKLDGDKNVVPATMKEFSEKLFKKYRVVKQETYKGVYISTVFLGFSHSFDLNKPGLFFETMIFDTKENLDARFAEKDLEYQERCDTWEEALKMHETAKKYIDNLGV